MKIVLASGSPRRRELMHKITDDFLVITADIDERKIEEYLTDNFIYKDKIKLATKMVERLSFEKANAVFLKLGSPKDTLVIGSDTTVCLPGEILGKPVDRDDAVRMLRDESKDPQHVVTGVSFITAEKSVTFSESSLVVFNKLDEDQEKRIQEYCNTQEPYDKAGAYGIQALGDKLVNHFEGDINNIIGFPVDFVREKLKEFGDFND